MNAGLHVHVRMLLLYISIWPHILLDLFRFIRSNTVLLGHHNLYWRRLHTHLNFSECHGLFMKKKIDSLLLNICDYRLTDTSWIFHEVQRVSFPQNTVMQPKYWNNVYLTHYKVSGWHSGLEFTLLKRSVFLRKKQMPMLPHYLTISTTSENHQCIKDDLQMWY